MHVPGSTYVPEAVPRYTQFLVTPAVVDCVHVSTTDGCEGPFCAWHEYINANTSGTARSSLIASLHVKSVSIRCRLLSPPPQLPERRRMAAIVSRTRPSGN